MATHSSILAWKIPRTEEPGGPQFIGFTGVGHDSVAKEQQLDCDTGFGGDPRPACSAFSKVSPCCVD